MACKKFTFNFQYLNVYKPCLLLKIQCLMIDIINKTINEVFYEATTLWGNLPFIVSKQISDNKLKTISYNEAFEKSTEYSELILMAGYGKNQRFALLLGNSIEHFLVKLALNRIGISCVPLNPDSSEHEISFILDDSAATLVITCKKWLKLVAKSIKINRSTARVVLIEEIFANIPNNTERWTSNSKIETETEASLLYTSGTTGKPKGCILSNEYELMCGDSYRNIGPPVSLKINGDKIFNPLPSYHINAGVLTFFGVLLTGNCLVLPDRFSISSFWHDIEKNNATIFHYLGVIIAVILSQESKSFQIPKSLRLGLGAGVEPALHSKFENLYNIPLIECWGMTEMCRIIANNDEPRMINTRAFGRPRKGLEVLIVDQFKKEVPRGKAGQMVIRYNKNRPRRGAFSGYLNNSRATEEAWEDGWFHTGDTVIQNEEDMLFFVDRSKNIIRRSGENIAAAEVENVLLEDQRITKVACVSVSDTIREEEVLACIVLSDQIIANFETAKSIFLMSLQKLAYFKTPGWILFLSELPVTGTQKVLKHKLFLEEEDPTKNPDVFDLRFLKKRRNDFNIK